MITDKQFLNDTCEEEVFSLIESFFNRWVRQGAYDLMDKDEALGYEDAEKEIYKGMPTDKQKYKVIKKMIKDFSKYKN